MTAGADEQHVGIPLAPPGLGTRDGRNSGTQYDIPNRRVTGKSLPVCEHVLQDVRAARARHCPPTSFATEQLVDELAHAAGMDRIAFRLQNISTAQVNDGFGQWRDALVGVARLAGWRPRVPPRRVSAPSVVTRPRDRDRRLRRARRRRSWPRSRSNLRSGRIRATHLYAAQVCGLAVYLPGVENQLEGNLIMGTSRALNEEVAFDRGAVEEPRLGQLSDPALQGLARRSASAIVQRADLAPTGSGEPPRCRCCRDRECVLRRDRRADPDGADDAGAGAGRPRIESAALRLQALPLEKERTWKSALSTSTSSGSPATSSRAGSPRRSRSSWTTARSASSTCSS